MNNVAQTIPQTLRELEGRLQTESVRKDAGAVGALLADDFREFGSSGRIFNKSEIIAALQAERPFEIAMLDAEVTVLSEQVALLTYREVHQKEGSMPAESLRSSLWQFREGRWQMVFHQATVLPEPV